MLSSANSGSLSCAYYRAAAQPLVSLRDFRRPVASPSRAVQAIAEQRAPGSDGRSASPPPPLPPPPPPRATPRRHQLQPQPRHHHRPEPQHDQHHPQHRQQHQHHAQQQQKHCLSHPQQPQQHRPVEELQSVVGADLLRHLAAPSQREQLTHEFVLGFLAADTDSGAGWGGGGAPRQPSRHKKQHTTSGGGGGVALPPPRGLQGQVAEHLLAGGFDEALLESVPTHTLNWVIKVGAAAAACTIGCLAGRGCQGRGSSQAGRLVARATHQPASQPAA